MRRNSVTTSPDAKNKTLLIKNADYMVTVDRERRVLRNASVFAEGNIIKEVGSRQKSADKIVSGRGKIVLPGFINAHAHLYQTIARTNQEIQNQPINVWIAVMTKLALGLTPESIYAVSLAALAELVKYGCTTVSDFYYLPNSSKKDLIGATIKAAGDLGVRFHPNRGSMDLGKKQGGLFPNEATETISAVMEDSERLIKKYHNPDPFSMCKVSLAPCAPYLATTKLYQETRKLSRKMRVFCHTHLAETVWEVDYCLQKFGRRPVEYMESLDWLGEDVWFAHMIYLNDQEINLLNKFKTGIAHCPCTNIRAKGKVPPLIKLIEKGVNIGLGTDGAAGNDANNLLAEGRWSRATLEEEVNTPKYLKTTQALDFLTIGGAKVLGREELGSIEPGKACDLALFPVNVIETTGTNDPIGSLVSAQTIPACDVVINGRVVLENGELQNKHNHTFNSIIGDFHKTFRRKSTIFYTPSPWISGVTYKN